MTTHANSARTIVFHEIGGPEVLVVEELALPAPGPGEVSIRVEALGINRAEVLFRSGGYYYQPTLPGSRLGYEASGIVEAVGPGVTEFEPGDPVITGSGIEMSTQGVYADQIVLPVVSVTPRPAGLDAVSGAAVWLAYTTAYGGLVEAGGLSPGDHVLITAAAGGVGIAAIQTAARVGAIPLATTRDPRKRQHLLDAGAAHVIVTGEQDTVAEVHRLTGGNGAEVIFDAVGGPELPTLAQAAAHDATIVVYGWLDDRPMVMPRNWPLTVRGYANQSLTSTAAGRRRAEHFLAAGFRDHTFRPVIAEVVHGLANMPQAHRLMESNNTTGKIVLTV